MLGFDERDVAQYGFDESFGASFSARKAR